MQTSRRNFNGGVSSAYSRTGGSGAVKDQLFNRILVAGCVCENSLGYVFGSDDGPGRSGGFPSQGLWCDGKYGYSFGLSQNSSFVVVLFNLFFSLNKIRNRDFRSFV